MINKKKKIIKTNCESGKYLYPLKIYLRYYYAFENVFL